MDTLEALREQVASLQAENKRLREERQNAARRSSTPYDDAWRTLTTCAPRLLIPMVNEVFGAAFSEQATVRLRPNEQLSPDPDGRTERRVTDTNFSLWEEPGLERLLGEDFAIQEGERENHYVFECESRAVSAAVFVRIVEYAVKAGVDAAEKKDRTKLRVEIPHSAVLSLRSTENTPEEMELEIVMEEGTGRSRIRVMKLSDYAPESIFEKKLYLLIPFLLFNYEKRFRQIQEDEAQYHALLEELRGTYQKLDTLASEEEQVSLIDVFTAEALRAMTHAVVNGLAEHFPKIQEGVNTVVGGNIIEFEALKIKREGIREGRLEGIQEGIQKGRLEGRQEGKQEGKQEGIQEGIQKGKMLAFFESVQDGDMRPDRAARRAGQETSVFLENMRKAGYTVPEARV